MNDHIATYPSKELTREARRLFADCKRAAKEQGQLAIYNGYGIRVGGANPVLVVHYSMGGVNQESTLAL